MFREKRNQRILVVDDNQAIHTDFQKILAPKAKDHTELDELEAAIFGEAQESDSTTVFDMESAHQGEVAVQLVEQNKQRGEDYAVAFVDMRMPPGWDGIKTIEELWRVDPNLHVVICTAYSDYSWGQISDRLGDTDKLLILKKPFDNIEVLQLAHSLCEKAFQTKQAAYKYSELQRMVAEQTHTLREEVKERRVIEGELIKAREVLEHQASHDPVTGLRNRRAILALLEQSLESNQSVQRPTSLLFIDIDHFKTINDTHGHLAGDEVLKQVGLRMSGVLRRFDRIGRYGGEEFLIVLPACQHDIAPSIARRIVEVVNRAPVIVYGAEIAVTVSVGVATSEPQNPKSKQEIVAFADAALYRAKAAGRNCVMLGNDLDVATEKTISCGRPTTIVS